MNSIASQIKKLLIGVQRKRLMMGYCISELPELMEIFLFFLNSAMKYISPPKAVLICKPIKSILDLTEVINSS